MKRVLFLGLVLAALATSVFAWGPDTEVVSATTTGTVWVLQDTTRAPRPVMMYTLSKDDSYTAYVKVKEDGTWRAFNGGTGVIGTYGEIHVPKDCVMPISGKFHKIFYVADTTTADIENYVYTE